MRANHRLFVWAPRVLGLATALFFSVFALGVLNEPSGLVGTFAAFAIHLVPAAIVAATVAVAWRWELAGAAGFFLLAGTYLAIAAGRFPWTVYAAISGPLFMTGALLVASWTARRHGLGATFIR